jgi:hypothetical protein
MEIVDGNIPRRPVSIPGLPVGIDLNPTVVALSVDEDSGQLQTLPGSETSKLKSKAGSLTFAEVGYSKRDSFFA